MADHHSFQERRITVRLLSYWEKLRGERLMPELREVDPLHLRDLWGHCFLVKLKEGKASYEYAHMGEMVLAAYHGGFSGLPAGTPELPGGEWLSESYAHIAGSGKPVVDEGEFRNLNNEIVKYRQCLLPLGDSGRVHAILGGMRCRIYGSNQP